MKIKNKFGNLHLVGVLLLEIAGFGAMMWNSKHISEMFYFFMMGMFFVIPCLKEITKGSNVTTSNSKSNNTNSSTKTSNTSNNGVKQDENKVTELKNYKKKVCTTNGYEEFNNLLRASVQNKLMDRDCILKLKHEIRHLLGTHVEIYIGANSKFKFKNDLHEIYTLSKSSVLKEKDYDYLAGFLSSNLDLSNAKEVD